MVDDDALRDAVGVEVFLEPLEERDQQLHILRIHVGASRMTVLTLLPGWCKGAMAISTAQPDIAARLGMFMSRK